MKKIERLLAIVMALKQNGKMTASDIAALLEVNIRTIYRDIDALSQMDVPLVSLPITKITSIFSMFLSSLKAVQKNN